MSTLFPRTDEGTFKVLIGKEERALVKQLAEGIRQVVSDSSYDGDPALQRLFPPAYGPEHADKNAEYSQLMHEDLRAGRVGALTELETTLDANELTEEQLLAWLGALNDIRLFLGTRLDVTEDMREIDEDDPRAPMLAVYGFLSLVQEEVVEALQGG